MRKGINRDLGFLARERSENLRRSIEIARLLNDVGLICVGAFMAPSQAVRDKTKAVARNGGATSRSFFDFGRGVPSARSTRRLRDGGFGRVDDFPGVSAPYQAPSNPDLVIDTERVSIEESVDRTVALLKARGVLSGM